MKSWLVLLRESTGFLRLAVRLSNDFGIQGQNASFVEIEKDFIENLFLQVFTHPLRQIDSLVLARVDS